MNEKHKEIQNCDNLTALGLLSLAERRSASIMPVKEKIEKQREQRKPGKFSTRISSFVQGVLDLVDDENEDVSLNNQEDKIKSNTK